jgi:hypothetical protein
MSNVKQKVKSLFCGTKGYWQVRTTKKWAEWLRLRPSADQGQQPTLQISRANQTGTRIKPVKLSANLLLKAEFPKSGLSLGGRLGIGDARYQYNSEVTTKIIT